MSRRWELLDATSSALPPFKVGDLVKYDYSRMKEHRERLRGSGRAIKEKNGIVLEYVERQKTAVHDIHVYMVQWFDHDVPRKYPHDRLVLVSPG